MSRKKTKKKNQRKKLQKKIAKKILRKKPMRKKMTTKKKASVFSSKIVTKKSVIEKLSPLVILPVAQSQPKVTARPEKIEMSTNKSNTLPSRHILDLRQVQVEKRVLKNKQRNQAESITKEVLEKFGKKNDVSENIKNIYSDLKARSKSIHIKTCPQPKEPRFISPIKISNIKTPVFSTPPSWLKRAIAFAIVCVIITIPLFTYNQYQGLLNKRDSVIEKTALALSHLSLSGQAASARDFYDAGQELQAAASNFSNAENQMQNVNLIVQGLIKIIPELDSKYSTAENLISAGKDLSESAATLTDAVSKFTNQKTITSNLADRLSSLKDSLNIIQPDLISADDNLSQIDFSDLPVDYQDKIKSLQDSLPLIEKSVSQFLEYSNLALKILGQDSLKRYLVLFQNCDELRPTGGFIGSYALLDLDNGSIKKISVPGGGPYDLKAGLKVSLSAPRPLRILNQRWEFQDANWFADLPTSAEKLSWLYEKSGGPTVDGLIFINSKFVQNLLKITGPIELPSYGKTITADNFVSEVQQSVEFDYDKNINMPKQIIADLTPRLVDKLMQLDEKGLISALDLVFSSLNQKDIQLYFSDYSLEKNVLKNNWGGQVRKTDEDYLEIVSTNIAGEKSDAKIAESADLKVSVQSNGSIIDTLSIIKTHLGQKGEPFYGVPNLDYLRIYVPKGSEFLSASGFEQMEPSLFDNFDPSIYKQDADLAQIDNSRQVDPQTQTEIYNEGDKTVLANWMKVDPGQTQKVTISWRLPFALNLESGANKQTFFEALKGGFNATAENGPEKYSLLLQKQSGKDLRINVSLEFPENLDYQMLYPDTLTQQKNTFSFMGDLDTDKFLAIVFKKQ